MQDAEKRHGHARWSQLIADAAARMPQTWEGRAAYTISLIGSPPVLGLTAVILLTAATATLRTWLWGGLYALLAIVVPLLYVLRLARRGAVSGIDLPVREERVRPMVFAILCSGLAWLMLVLAGEPAPMLILAGTMWLQMALMFVITLRWKISMHSATAAGVGVLASCLAGTIIPLLLGVPIIAWSRVRLQRHTLAQTVAGAALGLALFTSALLLMQRC